MRFTKEKTIDDIETRYGYEGIVDVWICGENFCSQ